VAPGAEIIAGKVIGSSGETEYSTIVTAIYWAINGYDNKYGTSDDFNPDVINISIGGGASLTLCDGTNAEARDLAKAIQYARDHGALVVVASGNRTGGVMLPGCLDKSFTVGAVDSSDQISPDSNRGEGVDLVAPGVNIYSTLLGSSYGMKGGTSMAKLVVRITGESFEYPLTTDVVSIGKHPQKNDLVLSDSRVSREHAILRRVGDSYEITDLGSLNGTTLNGVALPPQKPHLLRHGDVIVLGQAGYLTFQMHEEQRPPAPEIKEQPLGRDGKR